MDIDIDISDKTIHSTDVNRKLVQLAAQVKLTQAAIEADKARLDKAQKQRGQRAEAERAEIEGYIDRWEMTLEDEDAALHMWAGLKAAYGDPARWDAGVELVAADGDGNLPAEWTEDYYSEVYDRITIEALSPYVDWEQVASALSVDYHLIEVTDCNDNTYRFYTRS